MLRSLVRLSLVLVLASASPSAWAQAPKAGGYYEDKTDLGFKIQVPKDWDFVPPQPNDPNTIGKYAAPHQGGMRPKSISGVYWGFEVQIAKFDRREKAGEDSNRPRARGAAAPTDFLEDAFGNIDWAAAGEKSFKVGKLPATELQFTGTWTINSTAGSEEIPVRAYVAVIAMAPDLDVALFGNGPGDEKKWSKFESAFQSMARSFKPMEAATAAPVAEGSTLREQKRAKVVDELTRLPGWKLFESPNYFVLTDSKDEPFVKEMMDRLEAIRKIYEETYTAKQALDLRRKAIALQNARTDGGAAPKPKPTDEEDEPKELLTEADLLASFEASRACVVRLCSEESMYSSYGGPPQTAGYWSPFHEELVVFDDQKDGGRNNTWKTLNHEAFHQYIYYFYGSLAPHSWYNEGSGDFYAGYQYGKNKKFVLKPFDWRVQPVKDMLRETKYVPLKTLVRYTQGEYYGVNKEKSKPSDNYAQGWSFIYFLRTAPGKFSGWNPAWSAILPTYLETLAITGDLEKSVDAAFGAIDFDQLETAWKAYLEKEL